MTSRLPAPSKNLRVIGFDDAPFRRDGAEVHVSGVVCSGTRFEGMVWGVTEKDGWGATDLLADLLINSKYNDQVHVVLLDGIAVGGLSVIDLPALAARVDRPCIAVMRKQPDLAAMERAIRHLPSPERRLELLARAGTIYEREPFVFQTAGIDVDGAHAALKRSTDTGHVPEALRIAHLIGSAVMDGQSRGRA